MHSCLLTLQSECKALLMWGIYSKMQKVSINFAWWIKISLLMSFVATCSLSIHLTDEKCLFYACSCEPPKNEKCQGWPPLLMDIGPPCAPWCTMQANGAQCRSVVHKVVLYLWAAAQCRFDKPSQNVSDAVEQTGLFHLRIFLIETAQENAVGICLKAEIDP